MNLENISTLGKLFMLNYIIHNRSALIIIFVNEPYIWKKKIFEFFINIIIENAKY